MINISERLDNELHSAILPPCDIEIVVKSGVGDFETEQLHLTADDIVDLKFKSTTDMFGKELPTLTATWQVYGLTKDGLNLDTTIHDAVSTRDGVDISFVYILSDVVSSWEDLKNSYDSWASVKTSFDTWNDVLSGGYSEERITLPRMFLTKQPVWQDDKWFFEARDILSFMSKEQNYIVGSQDGQKYELDSYSRETFANKLINSEFPVAGVINDIYTQGLWKCDYGTPAGLEEYNPFSDKVVVSGQTKNILRDMWASIKLAMVFDAPKGGFSLKRTDKLYEAEAVTTIGLEQVKQFPQREAQPDVKNFKYKKHKFSANTDKAYQVTAKGQESHKYFDVYESYYNFVYSSAGTCFDEEGNMTITGEKGSERKVFASTKKCEMYTDNFNPYWPTPMERPTLSLAVYPIEDFSEDVSVTTGNKNPSANSADYEEDNIFNTFATTDKIVEHKAYDLGRYYYNGSRLFSCETFGLPFVECGDMVSLEINEEQETEYKKVRAFVVETEITYNGAISQTLVLHEIVG